MALQRIRFRIHAERSGDTIMSDLFGKAALVTGASLEAIPPRSDWKNSNGKF
jgi:hypothetical protein